MIPFDKQWPFENYAGDYIAFINSMTKAERIAWRIRTDKQRNVIVPRGVKKVKVPTQAENLLDAINFIDFARADDEQYKKFIRLKGKMAISFNGQISAGYPIEEELTLCPEGEKFKKAIAKSGNSLTIVETPGGQISIKGEKIKVLVQAVPETDLPTSIPDVKDDRAIVGNLLKEAFTVCGTLASENGKRVIEASLLLEDNTCTGTNGAAMLQYWHGYRLPPMLVIPKLFAAEVAKQTLNITGIGFGWNSFTSKINSVTIWFENGAWIKTMCYEDEWPDIGHILNVPSFPVPVLPDFFEAIDTVDQFSDNEFVYFGENKISSHSVEQLGAEYTVQGLQAGKMFKSKLIKQLGPYTKSIDITTVKDRAFVFGGTDANPIRGAIMGGFAK
jgi:hypothetical protein